MSLLVIYKIVRLFVNALTTDDKHYLLNRDNLTQPIQMKLSQNQKNFSDFFCVFKIYVKFNVKTIPLEKVFFSGIQNPKTLC